MATDGVAKLLNQSEYGNSYYSKWERRREVLAVTPKTKLRPVSKTPTVSVGARTIVSSLSKYGPRRLAKVQDQEAETESTRLLQMKIASCKSAIASFNEREQDLLKANLAMKEYIIEHEKPEHDAVKKLLRRYEKFRGGMSFLSENFRSTISSEKNQLKDLEQKLQKELESLQEQVDTLDIQLKEQQNQVYVLNNYKDKEYPVKAIRISELVSELDQVEIDNDDELVDLERVVDTELRKLKAAGHKEEMRIKESALTSALNQMHPTLKDMATQNQVMENEIAYHKQQIDKLHEDIGLLREEVKKLLLHPKTNVRLQMFPELFKYDKKCTPDMDIVLDIPKSDALPI